MSTILEQMTGQPGRKCRPETLLRLLISTSYPQSVLSDLTFDFTRHSGVNDEEQLELLAGYMREVEKSFDMFDFIRCIEIRRDNNEIKIVIKRLDFDPTIRVLNDSVDTHEQMAASSVSIEPNEQLEDVDQLAVRLLEIFYRSQVKAKRNNNDISATAWKCRTRENDRKKSKDEQTVVDSTHDFQSTVDIIATSLNKRRFHLVLTQNAFLLLDQRRRIWGVSKG